MKKSYADIDALVEEMQHLLKSHNIDPTEGLPESLFVFSTSIVPTVNIDLFIHDNTNRILLSWRDDIFCGHGWHIPGGCVRLKEKLIDRVRKTSIDEIGTEVIFNPVPIMVSEDIEDQNRPQLDNQLERCHCISLLYECMLPQNYCIRDQGRHENEAGYLKWFDKIPSTLLECHKRQYGQFLESWFEGNVSGNLL